MIEPVRCDHQSASENRQTHFHGVRGETIAPPSCTPDTAKSCGHQCNHPSAAVNADTANQCECSNSCNRNGQCAMHPLFRRQEMCRYRTEGEDDGSKHAVNHTEGGSPNAESIRPAPL